MVLEGSDESLCCTDLRDMDDTFEGRGASAEAASFISRKALLMLVDCLMRGTGIVTGVTLLFVRPVPVTALSSVSVSLSVGKVSTAKGLGLVCDCAWNEVTEPASVRWRYGELGVVDGKWKPGENVRGSSSDDSTGFGSIGFNGLGFRWFWVWLIPIEVVRGRG